MLEPSTMIVSFKKGKKSKRQNLKRKNLIRALISILGISLFSKFQLTQGQMGWNCDLNIYNFSVLSFSKFIILEGRN